YGDWRGGQRQERRHGGPEPARRGLLELQTATAAYDARRGENGGERYAGCGGGARGVEKIRPGTAALRRQDDAGTGGGIGERPQGGDGDLPRLRRACAGAL